MGWKILWGIIIFVIALLFGALVFFVVWLVMSSILDGIRDSAGAASLLAQRWKFIENLILWGIMICAPFIAIVVAIMQAREAEPPTMSSGGYHGNYSYGSSWEDDDGSTSTNTPDSQPVSAEQELYGATLTSPGSGPDVSIDASGGIWVSGTRVGSLEGGGRITNSRTLPTGYLTREGGDLVVRTAGGTEKARLAQGDEWFRDPSGRSIAHVKRR